MNAAETRQRIEEIKDLFDHADPLVLRQIIESLLTAGSCFVLLRKPIRVLPTSTIVLDYEHHRYEQRIAGTTIGIFAENEMLAIYRNDFSGRVL